nr:IS4 family transposase [Candidatus Sigynarchaeota archaeon]
STMESFRFNPADFSRERCFTFPNLVVAILEEHAGPTQARLNHLSLDGAFKHYSKPPTVSAFSQARQKISPWFFKTWLSDVVQFFYDIFPRESAVATWKGMYLWAVDCSKLTLPDTPSTRSWFSIQTNNVPGSETVQAQASLVYDVLNNIPVDVGFGEVQAETNFLKLMHSKHLGRNVLAIYDRGYANYPVVAMHALAGANFVIRCPSSHTFKIVEDFLKSDETDVIVTLRVPEHRRREAVTNGWPFEVQVRLVKILLPSGEIEVLMTSLLDRDKYPVSELQWIYGKRWGAETAFNHLKNILECEVFSSKRVQCIQQEFYGMAFLDAFQSILNKAQDIGIKNASKEKHLKYEYHLNKAGAISVIFDHLVDLFIGDEMNVQETLASIFNITAVNKSPIRPGRHNQRVESPARKTIKYLRYQKKRRP